MNGAGKEYSVQTWWRNGHIQGIENATQKFKKAIWDTEMVSPKILVPLSHFLTSQTSSSKNINIKAY